MAAAQCTRAVETDSPAAAEILMGMVPEADLYISRIHDSMQLNGAVDWMNTGGVDVISMSRAMFFEGPGDGTDNQMNPALDAMDRAVSGNIVWINSVGNYADGEGWSVRNPATHDKLIVFDSNTNDTINRFRADAGEDVSVWLRWHDADNSNTDLNLLLAGTSSHHGIGDQWRGVTPIPVKGIRFVPPSSGVWDISLAVIGTATPDWIQMFIDGNDSDLERHTGEGTIANPRLG